MAMRFSPKLYAKIESEIYFCERQLVVYELVQKHPQNDAILASFADVFVQVHVLV